jgi:hypothetical protein
MRIKNWKDILTRILGELYELHEFLLVTDVTHRPVRDGIFVTADFNRRVIAQYFPLSRRDSILC